jgi:hypothetical protein
MPQHEGTLHDLVPSSGISRLVSSSNQEQSMKQLQDEFTGLYDRLNSLLSSQPDTDLTIISSLLGAGLSM